MDVATISPAQLDRLRHEGKSVNLIDVRTPAEFREAHADLAVNVPLDRFDPRAVMGQAPQGEPIYVICRSGARGCQAAEKLLAAGCASVANVEGGTQAWEGAGLPLIRGKKTISLERQVRIAAGSLVVLGAALSVAVHPWFVGLCAFVGAGLVFAGVTDTCGMGMILARMPWNQAGDSAPKDGGESCSSR